MSLATYQWEQERGLDELPVQGRGRPVKYPVPSLEIGQSFRIRKGSVDSRTPRLLVRRWNEAACVYGSRRQLTLEVLEGSGWRVTRAPDYSGPWVANQDRDVSFKPDVGIWPIALDVKVGEVMLIPLHLGMAQRVVSNTINRYSKRRFTFSYHPEGWEITRTR